MGALPWLLGGGAAAVALYYWTQRDRDNSDPHDQNDPLPGRWVWPVGVWQGRKPEITDGNKLIKIFNACFVDTGNSELIYPRGSIRLNKINEHLVIYFQL